MARIAHGSQLILGSWHTDPAMPKAVKSSSHLWWWLKLLRTAAICINILSEVNTLQQQSLVLCRNPLLVSQRIQIILFNGFNSSMAAMQVQRIIELLMFDFSNVIHVQCAPNDGGASQLLVLTPWCIATSWAARH